MLEHCQGKARLASKAPITKHLVAGVCSIGRRSNKSNLRVPQRFLRTRISPAEATDADHLFFRYCCITGIHVSHLSRGKHKVSWRAP